MKQYNIEQIAIAVGDITDMKKLLTIFGCKDWVEDTVNAKGLIMGQNKICSNTAILNFNYDLGVELELLKYTDGENWHAAKGKRPPFISHMGFHIDDIDDMEKIRENMYKQGIGIAQEVFTVSHTNDTKGKKYHYIVFNSESKLGFDLKIIRRIMPAE